MSKRLQELSDAFPSTPRLTWRNAFRWCIEHEVVPMMTVRKPKAGSVYADRKTPPTEYFLRLGLDRRRMINESALWSECIDIRK